MVGLPGWQLSPVHSMLCHACCECMFGIKRQDSWLKTLQSHVAALRHHTWGLLRAVFELERCGRLSLVFDMVAPRSSSVLRVQQTTINWIKGEKDL